MPTFVPLMSLTTAHSLWLAPLCLLLGVAYAWWLYRRGDDRFAWGPRLALLLAVVRALVVSLLAFFLLEPMVRTTVREVRKPVIVIAHDGSRSLTLAGDTAALRSTYGDALTDLTDRLGERYRVRTFTYGETVRDGLDLSQGDGISDIGGLFREVQDRFGGPDLGAVIIDGDGIQNRGRDPRSEAVRLGVPVYAIALGDTTVRPDLAVKGVEHNRYTYLGNDFPVRVRFQADHLRGRRASVSVKQDGRELFRTDVDINGDPWYGEVPLLLNAGTPGLQRYSVQVAASDQESSEANNAQDFFVEVLDDRRNVLIVAAAPHPDVAALRQALSGAEGYVTDVRVPANVPDDLDEVDLLVLHGLPAPGLPLTGLLERCARAELPVLAIATAGSDLMAWSGMGLGVQVKGRRTGYTEAEARVAEDVSAFTLEDAQVQALQRFPPLQVPFAEYQAGPGAQVLLYQRIGVVDTRKPLLVLQQAGQRRMGALCGEGWWRWRMADSRADGQPVHFDALVRKVVQFLALQEDRGRFRVTVEDLFAENEPVRMEAEVYNASYEPVEEVEVTVELTDEEGRRFPYTFSRSGSLHRLEVSSLPPGSYTYVAAADLGDERLTTSGTFTVQALRLEERRTVADHGMWHDLAAITGGAVVAMSEVPSLEGALLERPEVAARSYEHDTFSALVDRRWIFFLLLALLTLEWALRRRAGGY